MPSLPCSSLPLSFPGVDPHHSSQSLRKTCSDKKRDRRRTPSQERSRTPRSHSSCRSRSWSPSFGSHYRTPQRPRKSKWPGSVKALYQLSSFPLDRALPAMDSGCPANNMPWPTTDSLQPIQIARLSGQEDGLSDQPGLRYSSPILPSY